mmetsp:Transcript_3961/g.7720  ORF Transcript_3961/g.7720 Transcript_3961/m.7720 type:complete len:114 (-) Transcript_3961:11-352(-)
MRESLHTLKCKHMSEMLATNERNKGPTLPTSRTRRTTWPVLNTNLTPTITSWSHAHETHRPTSNERPSRDVRALVMANVQRTNGTKASDVWANVVKDPDSPASTNFWHEHEMK